MNKGLPTSLRYQKTNWVWAQPCHSPAEWSQQGIRTLRLQVLQLKNGDSNTYHGYLTGMYVKVLCKPYCTLLATEIVNTPWRQQRSGTKVSLFFAKGRILCCVHQRCTSLFSLCGNLAKACTWRTHPYSKGRQKARGRAKYSLETNQNTTGECNFRPNSWQPCFELTRVWQRVKCTDYWASWESLWLTD